MWIGVDREEGGGGQNLKKWGGGSNLGGSSYHKIGELAPLSQLCKKASKISYPLLKKHPHTHTHSRLPPISGKNFPSFSLHPFLKWTMYIHVVGSECMTALQACLQ